MACRSPPTRSSCASDARGAFAWLTPRGREALEAARTTHHAGVRGLFLGRLSADERELLADVWERLQT